VDASPPPAVGGNEQIPVTELHQENHMSNESNRETPNANATKQPDELKASDFFPPGTGWNKAAKPIDSEAAKRLDGAPAPALPKQH
jgi:hypothetical protein